MTEEKLARPQFIEKLSKFHYARLARCVVVSGNIHDVFPVTQGEKTDFVALEELLQCCLSSARYPCSNAEEKFIIITIKSDGINFVLSEDKDELKGMGSEELEKAESPLDIIRAMSEFLRRAAKARETLAQSKEEPRRYIRPLCFVVDQADMIFPNLDASRLGSQDRDAWRYFYDLLREEKIWADADSANQRPDLIILLTPTIAELQSKILNLRKVEVVDVPLPDEASLEKLVLKRFENQPALNAVMFLAKDARGLTLTTLDDLITAAIRDPQESALNRQTIISEVDKRIELELRGIVKLLRPEHDFGGVVGFKKLKARLNYLARWIDDPKRAPAGMTVVGPNGAGKTYTLNGWAKGMGRTVIEIAGGMRSKWFGETEVFLEKFEAAASAYGRVCVIVDQAETAFGSIHDPETYQAEASFTRHIVQMISNTKYRGKIFWVFITARPDLLDPDFVRSGRCSLFVPICDPEGDDAEDFFNWMMVNFAKEGITLSEKERKLLKEKAVKKDLEFSAGDYKKFIDDFIYGKRYQEEELKQEFDAEKFINMWRPSASRIGLERKFQLLLAAKYCDNWRELLPSQYQDMPESEIQSQIDELKFQLAIK
ncbi:MAG: AAA family ATPase [Candidatus Nealsonbacteria bacterium]|nr:AAA family ATPase [Candidatus Nealsonbacteria bacterium]